MIVQIILYSSLSCFYNNVSYANLRSLFRLASLCINVIDVLLRFRMGVEWRDVTKNTCWYYVSINSSIYNRMWFVEHNIERSWIREIFTSFRVYGCQVPPKMCDERLTSINSEVKLGREHQKSAGS